MCWFCWVHVVGLTRLRLVGFFVAVAGDVVEFVHGTGDRDIEEVLLLRPLPRLFGELGWHIFVPVKDEDCGEFKSFGFVNGGESDATRYARCVVGEHQVDLGEEGRDVLAIHV